MVHSKNYTWLKKKKQKKKKRFPSPKTQYGIGSLEFQKQDMATEPIW